MMKRGFELLKTRPIDDKLDIEAFEIKYKVDIPPLYKLFIQTFYLDNSQLYDKVYIEKEKHYFEFSYLDIEIKEEKEVMLTEFVPIDIALEIRDTTLINEEPGYERGYIPFGGTGWGLMLLVGTKDEERDSIILGYDWIPEFIDTKMNVFEFMRRLVSSPNSQEDMPFNVKHEQLYKNFNESFWRIKDS